MRQRWFSAIMILALLIIATGAGARAQSTGEQDATYLKEIEVRDALLDKGGKQAVGIRVTVDGQKAILTGDVPTRATLELAEQVALSVEGIKSVDNRLKLAAEGGNSRSMEEEVADARLESKVKRSLYSEIGSKHARQIEVEATDGIVSLRGEVPDESRKQIALKAAGDTKGVKGVVDLLRIKT